MSDERIRHELEHGSRKTRDIGAIGVVVVFLVIFALCFFAMVL
jgi:hypothetical protein